jgi:hypothetical protein
MPSKQFITDAALSARIKEVVAGDELELAVAFWGKGAEKLIKPRRGPKPKIICNLTMGGTNPEVIRTLMQKAEVRQNDHLHAKVYISSNGALVASANASDNGVGLDNDGLAQWYEAGAELSDTGQARTWFNEMWERSWDVEDHHLHSAMEAWRRRAEAEKVVPRTIDQFEFKPDNLPRLYLYEPGGWEFVGDATQGMSSAQKTLHEQEIESGIEITDGSEADIFTPGTLTFFLWFTCKKRSDSVVRTSLEWSASIGREKYSDAYVYDGSTEQMSCIPAVVPTPQPPFEVRSVKFLDAFTMTIDSERFRRLKESDLEETGWLMTREPLLLPFWKAVQSQYRKSQKR